MKTAIEMQRAPTAQRRDFLRTMLPMAACLALALGSATAFAQTAPSTGCTTQKAGEGNGGSTAQKAGEGEGGSALQKVGEGNGGPTPQKAGEGNGGPTPQRAAAAAMPCKG